MRLRNGEFKALIAYQRYQHGRYDLLYINQTVKLLLIQLNSQLSSNSLFNSFISMSILPALPRFIKIPTKDSAKTSQTLKKAKTN